jgi:hypothetical protein
MRRYYVLAYSHTMTEDDLSILVRQPRQGKGWREVSERCFLLDVSFSRLLVVGPYRSKDNLSLRSSPTGIRGGGSYFHL